jgi:hypothetical protein
MQIDAVLSAILVKLDKTYKKFVDARSGRIYVMLDKALYGLVESARLFYEHLSGTLKGLGFSKNPYDQCVFNKKLPGKPQQTACFHVDDVKATCVDARLNDWLYGELEKAYPGMKFTRGPVHEYLGMVFDYTKRGQVSISMERYVDEVLKAHPVDGTAKTPAADDLFDVDVDSPLLSKTDAKTYHTVTAKLLYLAKRARPDVLTAVSYCTTRVQAPTDDDLRKLMRVLRYLQGCKNLVMTLTADSSSVLLYIDASYGVHPDAKSHTGVAISLGKGQVYASSTKQKLVTKSSTESELVGISDGVPQGLWTRMFMEAQGHGSESATLYQDNMSTIILAEKGRSTSSRTRHIHIRFFFIKDRIDRGEMSVVYLPTDDMISDILTKPLQGAKFKKLRKLLLNLD